MAHAGSNGQMVDDQSINEFQRGDPGAFEKIFLHFHGAVCYFAREFVRDPEIAKDLVADVFVTLWHLRGDFDNLGSIKAFLYVSARNACLNYLKRLKVKDEHKKSLVYTLSQEAQSEDVILNRIFDAEVLRELNNAIDKLPGQCKRVLQMTLEGWKTDEIAVRLELSRQTVKNTRVRATSLLKKQLMK